MNDVWSCCDDTVMNLHVLMYFYFSGNIFTCLCPFVLQKSKWLSLFVEWKLVTDARVENVLNKQNEVDAVSLTLGTFLATNCRSSPASQITSKRVVVDPPLSEEGYSQAG